MSNAAAAHIKAVLFDFDGTLADTAPDMVAALDRWLAARGRPPAAAEARQLCSGGARGLLNHCGIGEENIDAAVSEYLQYYQETGYRRTVLFGGIDKVLAQLTAAGIAWGVATNKPALYFAPIAQRLLAGFSPAALIARDDIALLPKPRPDTLLAAAAACKAGAAQCVYVGDDRRDGEAAAAAQMPFIAAAWGYWREEQWQDSPAPIAALLSAPRLLLPALNSSQYQLTVPVDSASSQFPVPVNS